jgi:hypothetical protein
MNTRVEALHRMTSGAISADHDVLVGEPPRRGPGAMYLAQRLAGLSAQAGRWLVPWITALLVSVSLVYAMDLGPRSERSWNLAQEPLSVVRVRPALEVPECPGSDCPFIRIDAPEGDW